MNIYYSNKGSMIFLIVEYTDWNSDDPADFRAERVYIPCWNAYLEEDAAAIVQKLNKQNRQILAATVSSLSFLQEANL